MTSCSENKAVNAAASNLYTRHFLKFEQCFCSKTDNFTGNLGANTIKHVSEMELYIILSTLENLKTGIGQFQSRNISGWNGVRCTVIPNTSYQYVFQHKINIIFIVLLSRHGMPRPKELSSDVMPYLQKSSTLKVNQQNLFMDYISLEYKCWGKKCTDVFRPW